MINWSLFIGSIVVTVLIFQRRESLKVPAGAQQHVHWALSFIGFLFAAASGYFSLGVPWWRHFVAGIVDYDGVTRIAAAIIVLVLIVEIFLAALPDFIVRVPMTLALAIGTIMLPALAATLSGDLVTSANGIYMALAQPVAQFLQGVLPR